MLCTILYYVYVVDVSTSTEIISSFTKKEGLLNFWIALMKL